MNNLYKSNIMKYKILLLSLLLLNALSNKMLAVSAYPYPITIKQADNTELTIQLVGDEFFSLYTDYRRFTYSKE